MDANLKATGLYRTELLEVSPCAHLLLEASGAAASTTSDWPSSSSSTLDSQSKDHPNALDGMASMLWSDVDGAPQRWLLLGENAGLRAALERHGVSVTTATVASAHDTDWIQEAVIGEQV